MHATDNPIGYFGQPDFLAQKCGHGHFVGRIDDAGHISALGQRVVSQLQVHKCLFVRLFKRERRVFGEIETRRAAGQALRIAECVLDGQFHIGQAHLRFQAAILKLHQRVDDGLRMHHHFNLRGGQVEQPFGLNHFQALVHQRGRVNGNLGSHLPIGVFQGLGFGNGAQELAVFAPERPARCGQDDFFDGIVPLTRQTLENGRMLGIHGVDVHALFAGQLGHQFARHHQRFLVGQRNILARSNGFERGNQPGIPDQRRQHNIYAFHLHHRCQ